MFADPLNFRHPSFRQGMVDTLQVAPGIWAWGLMTGVAMVQAGLGVPMAVAMVGGFQFRLFRAQETGAGGAGAEAHVHHLQRVGDLAFGLDPDALMAGGLLVAQGQHDGTDHRDQQHKAGRLEIIDIIRVKHAADRFGI